MAENYQNQPYQATYVNGPINFTVRVEDPLQAVADLEKMVDAGRKSRTLNAKEPITPKVTSQVQPVGEAPTCPYHNKTMTLKHGQYGAFWNCGIKLENGEWCKYRPPK